jgi:SagB-type dehydrogenase family enzyme
MPTRAYRRTRSHAMWFEGDRLLLVDYRSRTAIRCPPQWAALFGELDDPLGEEALVAMMTRLQVRDPEKAITQLTRLGFLLESGSPADEAEQEWAQRWLWGPTAGLFHYNSRDGRWASADEDDALMAEVIATEQEPLWATEPSSNHTVLLDPVPDDGFVGLARRRETARRFGPGPLTAAELGACLHAGLGFRGTFRKPLRPELPLGITPSAGARNPFEGYVISRVVDSLEPGIHHYRGMAHALDRIPRTDLPPCSELLAGQKWIDDAAVVVVLVAHLDRTMARYRRCGDYRLVLIEAGHIAQNILLAATDLNLHAAPISALWHSGVEAALGIDDPLQAALYAVAIGRAL